MKSRGHYRRGARCQLLLHFGKEMDAAAKDPAMLPFFRPDRMKYCFYPEEPVG